MKKFKILVLLACLFVPLAFAGCGSKNDMLSTPKIIDIKGGNIIFNAVKDADYYTISIDENEIVINPKHSEYVTIKGKKITYDASKIFTVGNSYSIKIKAGAKKKNSSKYSDLYPYKYSGTIKTPEEVKINSKTLTWNAVENATYYSIKIITPNDKVIFDKDGNVMSAINVDTIAQADITEYAFNTNTFDFTSLLNDAGKYQFYVCSVLADGSTYVESDYTSPTIYDNIVKLSAPTNGKVYTLNDELFLLTILDPNANAISVTCDNIEKTAEINGSEEGLNKLSDNLININLTKFFKSFVDAENLDLEQYKNYSFTTQSKYVSATPDDSYYTDSEISHEVMFENTYKLSAPTLNIEAVEGGKHLLSWESTETDITSSFKLIIFTPSGAKEYPLEVTSSSMLVSDNVIAASIQAVGMGNYLSSSLSDVVQSPNLTEELEFEYNSSGATIEWSQIEGAYYVIIKDDNYFVTTETSHTLRDSDFISKQVKLNLVAIKDGFKAKQSSATFNYGGRLATPTFAYNQGFTGANLYELTFTGSENAIGYYVYIKGSNSTNFVKLNTLYTTTKIDLSRYIISEGDYTDYKVKVQAIADRASIYADSNLSTEVTVSHMQVLDKPKFVESNGIPTPILKQTSAGINKYILQFKPVQDAASYEILINYNRISILHEAGVTVYKKDVSNYLTAANNYEIKIRALPRENAKNTLASEYNVTHYLISKQLPMVTNIRVTENEGIYTLSFNPVDNAERYLVRIVKENDSSYPDYLNSIGLNNYIYVKESLDVSDYVINRGAYNFYITALAPTTNSYYADANESVQYGTLNKLTSLKSPSEIGYDNVSRNSYILYWTGDEHADYYKIKLTDPNGIIYEFNAYATSANINQYMTIQGDYSVSIYSMVNPIGENAKEYYSSSATLYPWRYTYQSEKDFLRYAVTMYGTNNNFVVNNVSELKNLLWYHYLYGTGTEGLTIMLKHQASTPREAMTKLSIEATSLNLYDFTGTNEYETIINHYDHIDRTAGDSTWYDKLAEGSSTNIQLMSYLSEKILKAYPELNVLENLNVEIVSLGDNESIFSLSYNNKLNKTKLENPNNLATAENYASVYKYIDLYARKSATGSFAIDDRDETLVTTTEQLLQAVQHNKKPKFLGESSVAEKVYDNAKLVLSAIITKNMTDLEKVTAIFDWLEANYDLTYYNINTSLYMSGTVEMADVEKYGAYKIYYLEGIFEDITMDASGNLVIPSRYATSWSYSKAFALLCAIEGIDAKVINGTFEYYDSHTRQNQTAYHAWNKVYLSTTTAEARSATAKNWYVVDTTFSDNRIYFTDLSKGYGISSHTHFLVTDAFVQDEDYRDVVLEEKTYLISTEYQSNMTCTSTYNYYENSNFGMTYTQIDQTILDFEDKTTKVKGFNYSKQYAPESSGVIYQKYAGKTGYGQLQAFLLNSIIYSEYMADLNPNKRSVFEFSFKHSDNGNSDIFDTNLLAERFDLDTRHLSINLRLVDETSGRLYVVKNPRTATTTVIYVVEKTA